MSLEISPPEALYPPPIYFFLTDTRDRSTILLFFVWGDGNNAAIGVLFQGILPEILPHKHEFLTFSVLLHIKTKPKVFLQLYLLLFLFNYLTFIILSIIKKVILFKKQEDLQLLQTFHNILTLMVKH